MPPEQQPITGQEKSGDAAQPAGALAQFYKAFNGRDLSLMAENWADSEDVAMDNPLGGIQRGWPAIQDVYAKIFSGPAQVYVEFYDYTLHATDAMFYAVGRERGRFQIGDKKIQLQIRTSRVFEKRNGRWRQVHHHGSIESPSLLKEYQTTVLGQALP